MSESSEPSSPRVEWWCELQCPACRDSLADLRALRAEGVEIVPRHFPLSKHKHAFAAAQAVEEAFVQGHGWAFVEAVLDRVGELDRRGEKLLLEVAEKLGMDAEELDTALIDGRHILVVDADQAEGQAIGVKGTPSYVVAGKVLDGSKDQSGLRERIEELLGSRGRKG
jgi:protein-disulfide isomerase